MKKFKIINSISFSGNNLYLLNQPFDKARDDISFKRGRISSYHQKEQFKADWLCYPTLNPCEVLICKSDEPYNFDEALLFTALNNGLGLSRDNLFMLLQLSFDKIKSLGSCIILALMGSDFLPKHLSYEERKICPSLEIRNEENILKIDYDWWWVDQQFEPHYSFAFMKPLLQKNYYY